MVTDGTPAKRVTILVALGILALLSLLFVGLVQLLGFTGVAVFVGLVGLVGLVAVVAGLTFEVAFEGVAYAVGVTLNTVGRLGERFGR